MTPGGGVDGPIMPALPPSKRKAADEPDSAAKRARKDVRRAFYFTDARTDVPPADRPADEAEACVFPSAMRIYRAARLTDRCSFLCSAPR